MSNQSKVRAMSPKGFLHKSSGKIVPQDFINQHKSWLETSALASRATPILDRLEAKEILPTAALKLMQEACFDYMLSEQTEKVSKKKFYRPKSHYNYNVTLFSAVGEVLLNDELKPIQSGFDLSARAEGWADRRLAEAPPNSYAEVVFAPEGVSKKLTIKITVEEALSRILKEKKMASHRSVSRKSAPLNWGAKAKNDFCYFSRG